MDAKLKVLLVTELCAQDRLVKFVINNFTQNMLFYFSLMIKKRFAQMNMAKKGNVNSPDMIISPFSVVQ